MLPEVASGSIELTCITCSAASLSSLPKARSDNVKLCGTGGACTSARRIDGSGGVVLGGEPLPWCEGKAAFDVVVDEMAGHGGIEIGFTTYAPDLSALQATTMA